MFQATHDYLLSKYKPHTSHGTALIGATKMTKNGEFVVIIIIIVVTIIINNDHSNKTTFMGVKNLNLNNQQVNGVGQIVASGTGQIGRQAHHPSTTNVLIKTLILGTTIKIIIMIVLMMMIIIITRG